MKMKRSKTQNFVDFSKISSHFNQFIKGCSSSAYIAKECSKELAPLSSKMCKIILSLSGNDETIDVWGNTTVKQISPVWNRDEGPLVKIMRHMAGRARQTDLFILKRLVSLFEDVILSTLGEDRDDQSRATID